MKTLTFVLGCAATSLASAADMQPGLWEYTSRVEMPGMPVAMPPQTTHQCLTQADVDKGKDVAAPDAQQHGCQIANFKRTGEKISYDVACQGSLSHAEITNRATTMEGTTVTDMGGQKVTMRMTGKRVGDCK